MDFRLREEAKCCRLAALDLYMSADTSTPVEEFEDPKLLRYYNAVAKRLHPKVHKPLLAGISSGKLLALRRYLIAGPEDIEKKWAWNAQEEKDFKADRKRYDAMQEALEKVNVNFQKRCPDCRLDPQTKARNYETQLRLWNHNPKKNGLEEKLRLLARKELADRSYPNDPKQDDPNLDRFAEFIKKNGSPTVLGGTTTHAPPGLSDHGQLTAFDFVILKHGQVVAGTNTDQHYIRLNWEQTGYAKSLKEAIEKANCELKPVATFEGPLHTGKLYEPWHYRYVVSNKSAPDHDPRP